MTENLNPDAIGGINENTREHLHTEFKNKQPATLIAMNAVTANGIDQCALNYDKARRLQRRFRISLDNGDATSQKHSGRCWLFSSLNVARYIAKKNLGLKKFELSQNYAMYYDKLECANYILTDAANLIKTGEPRDSRLMQYLLSSMMGDGGQWTMAMNIYHKYGAVPKDLYPETATSQNTGQMNTLLRRVLRQAICRMYERPDAIDQTADEALADVHRILTISLGEPPRSFDWEWTDDDGEFHRVGTMTPVEFWNTYIDGDAHLSDYVCLVDDPRPEHPKGKKIGIEHLGNVTDGIPTEYLNVSVTFMKDCVRRILEEKSIPVWFGADCHPMMDRKNGAWATDLYDYESLFGVTFTMSKEERVRYADSAMNHAMAFTGVDTDDDGATTRWRVENSWGADIADKGYFTMDDPWFDEYVYEVAVPRDMLPAEYQAALDEPALSLPAWDPMGALA